MVYIFVIYIHNIKVGLHIRNLIWFTNNLQTKSNANHHSSNLDTHYFLTSFLFILLDHQIMPSKQKPTPRHDKPAVVVIQANNKRKAEMVAAAETEAVEVAAAAVIDETVSLSEDHTTLSILMTPTVKFKFICPGCNRPFAKEQAGLKHITGSPYERKLCVDFVCKFASNCELKFPPFPNPKTGKNGTKNSKQFPYLELVNVGEDINPAVRDYNNKSARYQLIQNKVSFPHVSEHEIVAQAEATEADFDHFLKIKSTDPALFNMFFPKISSSSRIRFNAYEAMKTQLVDGDAEIESISAGTGNLPSSPKQAHKNEKKRSKRRHK